MAREQGLALPRSGQYGLALCFPGPYSLGMAHLGFQSLMRLLFETPGWWGDRFFADTGSRSIVLRLPLSTFHVVAFSLSFELDIFPFLAMLKEGSIPLYTKDRQKEHPFVLLGGPVVTLNPEIVAPFADALVIGEAEVVLPRILQMWSTLRSRGASREEMWQALAHIPGVYVPELVVPLYKGGVIKEFAAEMPLPVYRQWTDISGFETRTFIYTPLSHFQRTALVELSRGCRYRCQFCAGRCIYAPLRHRPLNFVLRMIENVLSWQPEKIGLVGSDVLSHPEIKDILRWIIRLGKKVTLASLVGKDLYQREDFLVLFRQGGLETVTLAPETGDEVLRRFLGKGLSNDEWIDLVEECLKRGFSRVKLYFMLGKPNHASCEADIAFLRRLVERTRSPNRLFVSYSFLVPKPHTPLEDLEVAPFREWKKEKEIFEKELRKLKIPFSGESPRRAWVELILARGDRCLAFCLPELLEGEKFLSLPAWRKILARLFRDVDEWPRLPWREGQKPWQVVHLADSRQCSEKYRTSSGNHCYLL